MKYSKADEDGVACANIASLMSRIYSRSSGFKRDLRLKYLLKSIPKLQGDILSRSYCVFLPDMMTSMTTNR